MYVWCCVLVAVVKTCELTGWNAALVRVMSEATKRQAVTTRLVESHAVNDLATGLLSSRSQSETGKRQI